MTAFTFSVSPQGATADQGVAVLHQCVGVNTGADFSSPLGIFFDATRDKCYVADTGNNQIVVCDVNGMPIFNFYPFVRVNGERRLGEPSSIVVDRKGRIFVTDATVPFIDVLDHLGRSIQKIHPPDGCEMPERFEKLALGPDDLVYATMLCNALDVAVIGADLTIERIIKLKAPSAPSVRNYLSSIAVARSGRIYVTNPGSDPMIHIYDEAGGYIAGFGRHNTGWENFSFPAGIALMDDGDMWIIDAIRQIAGRFREDGTFVTHIGGKGDGPGAFDFPSGITSNGTDLLFVLERAGNRYQCFEIGGER